MHATHLSLGNPLSNVLDDLALSSSDLPRAMLSVFQLLERMCLAKKMICPA